MSAMRRMLTTITVIASLAMPVHAAAPKPAAASSAASDKLYEQARDHQKAGRFLDAARAYDAANAASPSVVLVYNAGRMYQKADELELAAARYRFFLAHELAPGERRERVVTELAQIDRILAQKRANAIATAAVEKVRLADLKRKAAAERRAEQRQAAAMETGGYVAIGIGGAGLIAALGIAFYAESLAQVVADPPRDEDGTIIWTPSEARQKEQEVDDLRLAAGITAGIGAAALATGIALAVVGASEQADEGANTPKVGLAPLRGGGAVFLGGSF